MLGLDSAGVSDVRRAALHALWSELSSALLLSPHSALSRGLPGAWVCDPLWFLFPSVICSDTQQAGPGGGAPLLNLVPEKPDVFQCGLVCTCHYLERDAGLAAVPKRKEGWVQRRPNWVTQISSPTVFAPADEPLCE